MSKEPAYSFLDPINHLRVAFTNGNILDKSPRPEEGSCTRSDALVVLLVLVLIELVGKTSKWTALFSSNHGTEHLR